MYNSILSNRHRYIKYRLKAQCLNTHDTTLHQTDKGLCSGKHDTNTVCQQEKVEQVHMYIKS